MPSAVVTIEAVVIQVVTEFRSAVGRQFILSKSWLHVVGKLPVVLLSSVQFRVSCDQLLIQLTAWPPPRGLRRSLVPPVVLPVDSTLPRFQP